MNERIKKFVKSWLPLVVGFGISVCGLELIQMPVTPSFTELIPCIVISLSKLSFSDDLRLEAYWKNTSAIKQPELKIYWWFKIPFKSYKATMLVHYFDEVFTDSDFYEYAKKVTDQSEAVLMMIIDSKKPTFNNNSQLFKDVLELYISEKPDLYCREKLKTDFSECLKTHSEINSLYRTDSVENMKLVNFYQYYLMMPNTPADVRGRDRKFYLKVLSNILSYQINSNTFNCDSSYYKQYKQLIHKVEYSSDTNELMKFIYIKTGLIHSLTLKMNEMCTPRGS